MKAGPTGRKVWKSTSLLWKKKSRILYSLLEGYLACVDLWSLVYHPRYFFRNQHSHNIVFTNNTIELHKLGTHARAVRFVYLFHSIVICNENSDLFIQKCLIILEKPLSMKYLHVWDLFVKLTWHIYCRKNRCQIWR